MYANLILLFCFNQLHLPMHSLLPGSELTKEPFRWDQRLFALILRMAGARGITQSKQPPQSYNDPAVAAMCEVTGGKATSYCKN